MIKEFITLVVAFVFLNISISFSQSIKSAAQKIDSIFSSYNKQTPGVAVAVVKDGNMVFKKGYGMANLKYNIPITTKTIFNLASVSKQFTAFCIYLLEDDGKLSLEDDIKKYLPQFPNYDYPITIKQLMSHTSGIRDCGAVSSIVGNYINADFETTAMVLKTIFKQKKLNFIPGTQFGYSNSNYTLLAEIVRIISGKSLATFAKERIFVPLKMNDTQIWDNDVLVVKNYAESYEKIGNTYYHKHLHGSNSGPSNVLSTIEDLSKWVLNFENPKVGTAEMIKLFNEPSYLNNGEKVIYRILPNDTVFHAKGQNVSKLNGNYRGFGGHTGGFRTFMGHFPNHNLSIIQLSNDEHHEDLGGRWDIFDFYIKTSLNSQVENANVSTGDKKTEPISFKTSVHNFTGNYFCEELETFYTITLENDRLVMKHNRLYDVELKRVAENKFSGSGDYTFAFSIEFINNEVGKIIGFDYSNWGAKNLIFIRKESER